MELDDTTRALLGYSSIFEADKNDFKVSEPAGPRWKTWLKEQSPAYLAKRKEADRLRHTKANMTTEAWQRQLERQRTARAQKRNKGCKV